MKKTKTTLNTADNIELGVCKQSSGRHYCKKISRRDFLKTVSAGAAAVTGIAALTGCKDAKHRAHQGEVPTDKMTYRTNRNTGDKVSLISYGMMRWEQITKGRSASADNPIDQDTVNRLVDYAIEHGVNYFDTSPAYCSGLSETITGIALKRHDRKKFFIATKMSNFAPSTWTNEASIAMYRKSFTSLQVNYIDYYLLHGVGMGSDAMAEFRHRFIDNGILNFLIEERRQGRIRNLGFSYHGDIKVFDYLLANHSKYKWDFAMVEMNYLDWHHAKQINPRNTNADYLYHELTKRNIPVVVMEPLLGGRLANLPDEIVASMKQREPEKSVASWAFRFCGTYPNVLTALSGMPYMEYLQDNIRTYSPLKPLTNEELDFLQEIAKKVYDLKTIPCNECQYCMPCPYGLDIPAILTHYNKCIREGNLARTQGDTDYKRMRRAFLVGYDRSVPKLRQADKCTGCGKCNPHCPQRIDIPAEMRRIDKYAEALKQDKL